jgi:hypothetical protein
MFAILEPFAGQGWQMDKVALLRFQAEARKSVENRDLSIKWQHEIITALEREGVDSTQARAVLARLIAAQERDLIEMESLLDTLDRPTPT